MKTLFDTYRNAANSTPAQNQISNAINEIVKNLQGEKGYVKFDVNTSFPYFQDDTIGPDAIIAARWDECEGELQFITESQSVAPEDEDAEWFHWMDYGKFDFNEFVFILERMANN